MITKALLLFTLLAYSMIVSQSFMYILSLKYVQLNLSALPYMELRKLTDISMRASFKFVIYAALLGNIALIISTIQNPTSIVFITSVIACIALGIDIMLTLKGNLPINDIINTWTPDQYPQNWADYRTQWLRIFQYRQIANITGFISLLVGVVFRLK